MQLLQVDQLIQYGHYSRAHAMLGDLVQRGVPEGEVRLYRIKIAEAIGDHAQAAELARTALQASPDDAGLWRALAAALFVLDEHREARAALDRFLALAGEPRSGLTVAVDLLESAGQCELAAALVDSARGLLTEPSFLARQRARCMLELGRSLEAAAEVQKELAANPYNLQLLRQDLLTDRRAIECEDFHVEVFRLAADQRTVPEALVFAANLALARGLATDATDLIAPHLGSTRSPNLASVVLQNTGTLLRELPIMTTGAERRAASDYLQAVLPLLGEHSGLSRSLRQRAYDHLAQSCLFALEHDLLDGDPREAVALFGRQLARVQEFHPESPHLYAAQIQLARFTRDRLRDPWSAAARLEHLVQDLDLPLEGLALARLTLGECYMAARDTVRARSVLTALGRDPAFRLPAGHAHFLLAKLDLAQGRFGAARDRFAAVALDNPAAPYANDALALGLLVAEELQNRSGGPDLLARYAHTVWWQLAAEPDSQRVALEHFVARAVREVDLTQQQSLLEQARLELAELHRQAGRFDAALAQLDRIVLDLPHGRQAAKALALSAEILADARGDHAAARREYERLLVQYPDYLFAAEVRQKLRTLP